MLSKIITAALASAVVLTVAAAPAQAQRWHRHHHNGYGGGAAAGIAGFAAGALIGGALASRPGYYEEPAYAYGPPPGDEIAYCEQRFRSYDPASGTYLGYDGLRHPCP